MNEQKFFQHHRLKIVVGSFCLIFLLLWQLTPTLVSADSEDDCQFLVEQDCHPELDAMVNEHLFFILSRYFVKGHDDEGCLYFDDVMIWLYQTDVFDAVADPIRNNGPNLYQYNQQLLIKAQGEIWEWDLEDAEQQGLASEMPNGRIRLATYCGRIPELPDPREDQDDEWNPGPPPWDMTKLEWGEMGSYGRLHPLTDENLPTDPPAAEMELLPQDMAASFLLVHENDMAFVEELLAQE